MNKTELSIRLFTLEFLPLKLNQEGNLSCTLRFAASFEVWKRRTVFFNPTRTVDDNPIYTAPNYREPLNRAPVGHRTSELGQYLAFWWRRASISYAPVGQWAEEKEQRTDKRGGGDRRNPTVRRSGTPHLFSTSVPWILACSWDSSFPPLSTESQSLWLAIVSSHQAPLMPLHLCCGCAGCWYSPWPLTQSHWCALAAVFLPLFGKEGFRE